MVPCWEKGERVPFIILRLVSDMISTEKERIVINHTVCNMLRTVMEIMPDDLLPVVCLAANTIEPSHEGLELVRLVRNHIQRSRSTQTYAKREYPRKPQAEHLELRDQGLVAKASRSSQCTIPKPHPLSVAKTFDTFRLIAVESGKDSHKKKKNWIQAPVVAAPDCEAQYLICLLQSRLRIGSAGQTLLTGLGQAAVCNNDPHPRPNIQSPSDLDKAAKIVKQVYFVLPVYGKTNLPNTCGFTPGVPVEPMLAKPIEGFSDILNKFQDAEKFTCEYKYDGERKYSRNAKHNTQILKRPSLRSFALDCEVVACEREKHKVVVCMYAFDTLYRIGQRLFQQQLKKFLDAAVGARCGHFNWVNWKKDYINGIGDLLDLKRTGVYGAFLLACYDSNNEEFQSSCEVECSSGLRSNVIPKCKYQHCYGYAIGIVDPDNAISLRFHRLIRVQKDKESRAGSVAYTKYDLNFSVTSRI
ncbi:DNA ligase 1 [Citrus sinensis]|uniref:DNA ligase 1 n=1 Tax=Citrus sinensis TaxID=2711 RepID=A0ACB8N9V7_CITSI|nr:DNA ligase 1 [Citrus sinensis]